MPKEVIHDDAVLPGDTNSSPFAVEVGWSRDSIVQIGTINLQFDQFTEGRGWFVDLPRAHVNRLIRALRRARDQAYGADE